MKTRPCFVLLALTFAFSSIAHAQEAPIGISIKRTPFIHGIYFTSLVIVSYEDKLVITDIELNRGNCDYERNPASQGNRSIFPLTLGFGEERTISYTCDNLIEALIKTEDHVYMEQLTYNDQNTDIKSSSAVPITAAKTIQPIRQQIEQSVEFNDTEQFAVRDKDGQQNRGGNNKASESIFLLVQNAEHETLANKHIRYAELTYDPDENNL